MIWYLVLMMHYSTAVIPMRDAAACANAATFYQGAPGIIASCIDQDTGQIYAPKVK